MVQGQYLAILAGTWGSMPHKCCNMQRCIWFLYSLLLLILLCLVSHPTLLQYIEWEGTGDGGGGSESSFTTFLVIRINYLYFLYFSSIISYKVSSAPVPSGSCQTRCEDWTSLDFISDLFQSVQNMKVWLKSQQTQELGFFVQLIALTCQTRITHEIMPAI